MIVCVRRPSQVVQLLGICAAAYSLLDIADIIDQGVDMIDQGRLVPSFLSHLKTLLCTGQTSRCKNIFNILARGVQCCKGKKALWSPLPTPYTWLGRVRVRWYRPANGTIAS